MIHTTARSQIQLSSLQRFRSANEMEEAGFYREEGSARMTSTCGHA